MYKHILIPTDGSELSQRAVREGIDLARSMNTRVTLVTSSIPFHVAATEPMMANWCAWPPTAARPRPDC